LKRPVRVVCCSLDLFFKAKVALAVERTKSAAMSVYVHPSADQRVHMYACIYMNIWADGATDAHTKIRVFGPVVHSACPRPIGTQTHGYVARTSLRPIASTRTRDSLEACRVGHILAGVFQTFVPVQFAVEQIGAVDGAILR